MSMDAFLFGFNVQFVSSCMVVSFAFRFYVSEVLLLYLCNKHFVNNLFVDAVQKSFSQAIRSSVSENEGCTLKFAPDWMETGRRSLSSIENVIDML